MTQLDKDVEKRFDERFPPITPHYTLGDPNYPCYRLTGHEYDSYGKCKICYNLSPELRRKLESENEESEYLKEMKQFLAKELTLAKEEGAREARNDLLLSIKDKWNETIAGVGLENSGKDLINEFKQFLISKYETHSPISKGNMNKKQHLTTLLEEIRKMKGVGINNDVRNFRDMVLDEVSTLIKKRLQTIQSESEGA